MNWAVLFTFDYWSFMTAISPLMLLEMGFPVWGLSARSNGWGFTNRSHPLPTKTLLFFSSRLPSRHVLEPCHWVHVDVCVSCPVLPAPPTPPLSLSRAGKGAGGSLGSPKHEPWVFIQPEITPSVCLFCFALPQEELQGFAVLLLQCCRAPPAPPRPHSSAGPPGTSCCPEPRAQYQDLHIHRHWC